MNKIYRLVRNKRTGRIVVASELARAGGQGLCSEEGAAVKAGVAPRRRYGVLLTTGFSMLAAMPILANAQTAYTTTQSCSGGADCSLANGDTITVTNGMGMVSNGGHTFTAPGGNIISTTGDSQYGMLASGNVAGTSRIDATGATITTTGTSAHGAYALSNGVNGTDVSLTNSQIHIDGAGAVGQNTNGAMANGNGATIEVTGGSIENKAQNGNGVAVASGGTATIDGAQISTSGLMGRGVFAQGLGGAAATIQGATQITTTGQFAGGIFGAGNFTVLGNQTTVTTTGTDSPGLGTIGFASGVRATLTAGAITVQTQGARSPAAMVFQQGQMTLNGTHLSTTGDAAPGLLVSDTAPGGTSGSGSTDSFITTTGIDISTTGNGANAIQFSGSNISSANNNNVILDPTATITTSGVGSHAVSVENGAQITFANTAGAFALPDNIINVQGADSALIHVAGDGSTATLNVLPAETVQSNFGVMAENGGTAILNGGVDTRSYNLWARGTVDGGGTHIGTILANSTNAANSIFTIDTNGLLDASGNTDSQLDPITNGISNGLTVGGLTSSAGSPDGVIQLGTTSAAAKNLWVTGADAPAAYSGTIQGFGTLYRQGTGTLTLSGAGAFNFTGDVAITDTSTLAVAGNVGSAAGKTFYFGNTGKLDISATNSGFEAGTLSSLTPGTGAVTLGAQNLTLNSAGNAEFSGVISGSGGITKLGTGTQTLTGANVFNYTGATNIQQGAIAAQGNASASGHLFNIGAQGTLDIQNNGGEFKVGMVNGAGAINLGANQLTVDGGTNLSGTYAGTISGTGSLVKENGSTLILSGNNAFNYTGDTIIRGGVLGITGLADTTALTKTVTLDGGWLDLSETNVTNPNENTANNWPGLTIAEGANANQGGIIGNNDNITYNVASGATQTVGYELGDGSTPLRQGLFVVKQGDGTLELTGNNHYVGNTRVEGGVLKVSADANLGDTTAAREVVLNGGALEIAGSFDSARNIELRPNATGGGTVTVDGANVTNWAAATDNGAGLVLTKDGTGTLGFTGASTLGGVIANAGTLQLGAATVTSTSTTPALQVGAATVGVNGGTLSSSGDTIVANADSTVNLSRTTLSSGANGALYRAINGSQGILNANAQQLNGLVAADGPNTRVTLNLDNGSSYTGVPGRLNGGTMALNLLDAASIWNVTGNSTVDALSNAGTIAMSSPTAGYKAVTVNGNYTGNNGTVVLHTELNQGGPLSNQQTDRLLIKGNVTGQTTIALQTTGSGANTNTAQNNQLIPSEGISLVQVAGGSTANAFRLAGDYVAAANSPFQYRLFSYGPGATDPGQSLLDTQAQWDYRLETSYLGPDGQPIPGMPGPGGGGGGRPLLVPQASSHLIAGLAVQNYDATVMDNLNRRLGDIRRDNLNGPTNQPEMFMRAIGGMDRYHSDVSSSDFGHDFDQDMGGLQIGGNWLHITQGNQDLRLGVAGTLGTTDARPKANSAEDSKLSLVTRNVALTATWQHKDGWYVDGVVSLGHHTGSIKTDQRGDAGDITARTLGVSLEGGKTIQLSNGLQVEPQAQLLSQTARIDGTGDPDNLDVNYGTVQSFTARVGVRVAMPLSATPSWTPYARVDLLHTWDNSPNVDLGNQSFNTGSAGSAVQVGLGASGMVNKKLSLYGEVTGRQRLGGSGFSGVSGTIGIRYLF